MKKVSPALKISVIYLIAGSIWIIVSDQFVRITFPSVELAFQISLIKGLIFVILTTIVIFFTAKYYINKIYEESQKKEAASKQLERSEQKYKLLFDDNPQPMWVYEVETLKFIDVNRAASKKYGYTKEEFLQMSIRDIRPQEEIKQLEEYISNIREHNPTHLDSKNWRHVLKSGEIIFVRILSHRIYLDGTLCRIVLATDVTDLIEKENALRQSEARYKRIFENVMDVYYESTIGGEILEVSPSINLLTYGSYTREELIGKPITSLYYDNEEREQYVRQVIKYGRVDDYEVRLINKDNRLFYCAITAKLIEEGEEQRIVGSIRDVSVRKSYEEDLIKAKEKAEKAVRLKTEFLAQMSHEIRTPLNIILNSASIIKEELSKEKQEEFADIFSILNSSGERITRTIDSILNMSELQTGTYEPEYSNLYIIKNVLDELIYEYQFLAEGKNLKLSLIKKIDDPIIYADRYSVTQIFSNLIHNAIKYTREGKIDVIVERDDSKILVHVKDTGQGMSKEFLPHLFEPFRQEQQGYKRTYEGNGLGLALVKNFCEINDAEIDVESELGEGSTFTVTFDRTNELD